MIADRPKVGATPRGHMSLTMKLAACLAHMRQADDPSRPLVPNADRMSAQEIIRTVHFDHIICLALGGKDHPANITPLPVDDHVRIKTPRDQRMIAKARHNREREAEFRARLLAKTIGDDAPRDVKRHRIQSRPFQKRSALPTRFARQP